VTLVVVSGARSATANLLNIKNAHLPYFLRLFSLLFSWEHTHTHTHTQTAKLGAHFSSLRLSL